MGARISKRDGCLLFAGMAAAYGSVGLLGGGATGSLGLAPVISAAPDGRVGGTANGARHDVPPPLSIRESLGFIEEPDEHWRRRKAIHSAQMKLQARNRHDCNNCSGHSFWQLHYEPSFSCSFERRVGPAGDGGKWVCDPHKIMEATNAGQPCLVYSIGSNGEFGFEKAVHADVSMSCEVHTFDIMRWQDYAEPLQPPLEGPPDYVSYHVRNVGETPMSFLYREMGHMGRTIDILKIDCEGCELQTVRGWFSEGVSIRQILVELHGPGGHAEQIHEFFEFLFGLGFVVFHKEPNLRSNDFVAGGNYIEYSLLRLSPEFSAMT
mmetsp:Transcript_98420/g.195176  ORF Transcript_98420/g.195176 Transcript_98420/m.195176 type:complete len:322 (+) Transcript_98420:87-1052(+)